MAVSSNNKSECLSPSIILAISIEIIPKIESNMYSNLKYSKPKQNKIEKPTKPRVIPVIAFLFLLFILNARVPG